MIFWLRFEIAIIFMDRTLNLEGIMTLSKIHIHLKMIKNKMSCTTTTINIYYIINFVPKFICMKKTFGKKDM
jgi:hypothetical protein